MLLAVSGLFVSSLTRVLRVDTGFAAEGAVTVEVAPGSSKYPNTPERTALYDRVLDRVRALPGVTAATWTSALPLTGETFVDKIIRRDRPDESSTANYRFVGPDYFHAIGMPIVKGRSIEEHDRSNTVTPAVISARAARTLWPGEDAIGREFTRSDTTQRLQVVGVVADGHATALESESPLMVYVPYWFNNEGKSVLIVRSRGDAVALVAAIRSAVRDVDPDVAIAKVAPLQHVVDSAVESRRYQATLFTAFGASALLIAIVGVYATTVYGVSRRRRELNIRVALGARASQVFSMVLRQSVTPVGDRAGRWSRWRAGNGRRHREPVIRGAAARSARACGRTRRRCDGGGRIGRRGHAQRPADRAGRGVEGRLTDAESRELVRRRSDKGYRSS